MENKYKQNFALVNINGSELPNVMEDVKSRYQWVPFGVHGQDDFFDALTLAHNLSTTTAATLAGI